MAEEISEQRVLDDKAVIEKKKQYMTFRSCDEVYGVSLENVSEIIGFQQYTEIPETEDYIKGLINLRGKIIPVIDVRIRFGKEPLSYNDRTSVIVIQVKGTVLGLIVDGIEGVVEFGDSEVAPPPSVSSLAKQAQKFVFGIGKSDGEVKLLLDPDKLVNDNDAEDEEKDEDEEE